MQYFFSYSRKDNDFAQKLADDLEALNFDVWFDQVDIQAGSNWDQAIEEGLNNAECMILILSSHSVTSENVLDEISTALARGKKIIPLRIEDCNLPLRIARLQHIDFITDYDAGIRHLTQTIKAINAGKQNQAATQNAGNAQEPPVNRTAQAAPTNRIADSHLNYKSTAPVPAQKSNKLRNTLLIAGGLILVIIIGYNLSSGDDPTNTVLVNEPEFKVSYSIVDANIIFSISENDSSYTPSIFVDVNQNKTIDTLIDREYTSEKTSSFCSMHLNSEESCGGAPSTGTLLSESGISKFTIPLNELRVPTDKHSIFVQFQFYSEKGPTANFPMKSNDDDFTHFYEIEVPAGVAE